MQKARSCGCIPLVASHWFRPISRIPLIAFHRLRSSGSFQRLTPKAHPERRISSFQGLHFMKRTSSRIATSCLSMEILKPSLRHPRNLLFAPHSSERKLLAGGSITFAFSLQEALQYLCRSKEQSRIAGRTRATSESSNSYHLRAFSIAISKQAPHLLHTFRVFYPRDLSHSLRTSMDESPSREYSRNH